MAAALTNYLNFKYVVDQHVSLDAHGDAQVNLMMLGNFVRDLIRFVRG